LWVTGSLQPVKVTRTMHCLMKHNQKQKYPLWVTDSMQPVKVTRTMHWLMKHKH
jgi:hypothetical protein